MVTVAISKHLIEGLTLKKRARFAMISATTEFEFLRKVKAEDHLKVMRCIQAWNSGWVHAQECHTTVQVASPALVRGQSVGYRFLQH